MRALADREKALLGLAAIAAAVALYHGAIISPLVNRLHENREGISQAEKLLMRYRALVSREESIVKQYKRLNLDIETSDKDKESVDLVKDLQRSAEGLFDFTTIRPTESAGSPGRQRALAAECDFTASLDRIVRFIHRLEMEQGNYVVVSMNLNSSTSEPDMLQSNLYIEARAE